MVLQFLIILTIFAFISDISYRCIKEFNPKKLSDRESNRIKELSSKPANELSKIEQDEFVKLQTKIIPEKIGILSVSYWLFTKMRELVSNRTSFGIWAILISYGLIRILVSKFNGFVIDYFGVLLQ